MPETDAELALSILRKIAADVESAILVERGEAKVNRSRYCMALIDSRWNDMTEDEADFLDRLQAEFDA